MSDFFVTLAFETVIDKSQLLGYKHFASLLYDVFIHNFVKNAISKEAPITLQINVKNEKNDNLWFKCCIFTLKYLPKNLLK